MWGPAPAGRLASTTAWAAVTQTMRSAAPRSPHPLQTTWCAHSTLPSPAPWSAIHPSAVCTVCMLIHVQQPWRLSPAAAVLAPLPGTRQGPADPCGGLAGARLAQGAARAERDAHGRGGPAAAAAAHHPGQPERLASSAGRGERRCAHAHGGAGSQGGRAAAAQVGPCRAQQQPCSSAVGGALAGGQRICACPPAAVDSHVQVRRIYLADRALHCEQLARVSPQLQPVSATSKRSCAGPEIDLRRPQRLTGFHSTGFAECPVCVQLCGGWRGAQQCQRGGLPPQLQGGQHGRAPGFWQGRLGGAAAAVLPVPQHLRQRGWATPRLCAPQRRVQRPRQRPGQWARPPARLGRRRRAAGLTRCVPGRCQGACSARCARRCAAHPPWLACLRRCWGDRAAAKRRNIQAAADEVCLHGAACMCAGPCQTLGLTQAPACRPAQQAGRGRWAAGGARQGQDAERQRGRFRASAVGQPARATGGPGLCGRLRPGQLLHMAAPQLQHPVQAAAALPRLRACAPAAERGVLHLQENSASQANGDHRPAATSYAAKAAASYRNAAMGLKAAPAASLPAPAAAAAPAARSSSSQPAELSLSPASPPLRANGHANSSPAKGHVTPRGQVRGPGLNRSALGAAPQACAIPLAAPCSGLSWGQPGADCGKLLCRSRSLEVQQTARGWTTLLTWA